MQRESMGKKKKKGIDNWKFKIRKVYKPLFPIKLMGKKTYLLFAIPLLAFAFIFAGMSLNNSPDSAFDDNPVYKGIVYTSTTGDFEGRLSEPHVGISELVGVSHNLLTTAGQNDIKTILGEGTSRGAYDYIGLCNASIACTAPDAGDTTLDNEFADSTSKGLNRSQGTYASISDGYYSIYNTFTADVNGMVTNTTGLFNQSTDGTLLAENSFTLVTLQSADQLTINWTINITDGG